MYTIISIRLQNCRHFATHGLMKSWEQFISGEKACLVTEISQKDSRRSGKLKGKYGDSLLYLSVCDILSQVYNMILLQHM